MIRRFPAWAILIAVIAALTLLPASPAAADPFDCKEAPTPTQPSLSGPANFGAFAALEPTGEDPFAEGSKTTVYREYGWPTTWWPTYDLGCGPDIARNPGAVVGSFLAEVSAGWALSWATAFDSLVHVILDWQGLGVIDGSLADITGDLRSDLWVPLIIIVVLLTAVWFVVMIIRGDHANTAKAAGLTLVTAVLLSIVINYPAKSAQVFDGTIKGVVAVAYSGTIDGADSGAEISDGIVSRVYQVTMYDRWCEGMVGGRTASADYWCPKLWKSMYLSAVEAQLTGDAKADLVEEKKDQFEELAEEIKEKDPSAYAVLTGTDYQTRMFAAVTANITWPLVALFPLAALFLMMVALVLLRVAVMLAPIFGPLLLHPTSRRMSRSTMHILGVALLNATLFGVGSAVFLRVMVAVMAAVDVPPAVRLTIMAVLLAAFWIIFKPWRHLTAMRPRKAGEPNDSAKGRSLSMKLVTAVQTRITSTPTQTATAPPPTAEAGNR